MIVKMVKNNRNAVTTGFMLFTIYVFEFCDCVIWCCNTNWVNCVLVTRFYKAYIFSFTFYSFMTKWKAANRANSYKRSGWVLPLNFFIVY